MNAEKLFGNDNSPYVNSNRVSGLSGLSGFTNTLHMGAQGYTSEGNSNRQSDCNSNLHNLNTRESFPNKNQVFQPARDNCEEEVEDKEEDITVITTTSTSYLPFASTTVKDFFRSSLSPGKQRRRTGKQRFNLRLSIQYETQIGEYLAVIGNIEELGNWNDFTKCHIQWTEGHHWVAENLVISSKNHFLYKYVIMEDGKPKRWEKGANRIADLDVLPDLNRDMTKSSVQSLTPSHSHMRLQKQKSISPERNPIKNVQIIDEWEHFKIRFSINDAIQEDAISNGDFMRIIGSTPKLGSKNVGEMEQTPPMRMSRAQRPFEWLFDKYGQLERPWEIIISFRNGELEFPNEIIYNYSKSNESGTSIVKEREPSRSMLIQHPDSYKGELGNQGSIQWKNSQNVWIVNGMIDKADANFLGGLNFDRIGDTRISLGTYPLREDDIFKMRDKGITGVLNLQTKDDIAQRGIPWKQLKQTYQQCNIRCFRFPLLDNNEDEYCASLFVVAQHLNNMINNLGLNVYVHCTSGICRAPAVALVYLCLFKRVKQWQNPYYVAQFVKAFHVNSSPNMRAVQRVVEANLEFQRQQVDINNKSQISGEDKSGGGASQVDAQPEFYFPQMVEKAEKKVEKKQLHPMKPRSAYIKKDYYRNHMEQINKNDQRSVTPLLPHQSQKMNQLGFEQMQHKDKSQIQLQEGQKTHRNTFPHNGVLPTPTSSSLLQNLPIGQHNFENMQPAPTDGVTIQNETDQFRSVLVPQEKALINQDTPQKMLKSAPRPQRPQNQDSGTKNLEPLQGTLAIEELCESKQTFNKESFELKASPKFNQRHEVDFGFKPVETEDISPPTMRAVSDHILESPSPQPKINNENIEKKNNEDKMSMGFDIIDTLGKQERSNKQTPTNDEKEKEIPVLSSMKETDGEEIQDDDNLIKMQFKYKEKKAARAVEFKKKRQESNSRGNSKERLFKKETKIHPNKDIQSVLTDDLLFGQENQQNKNAVKGSRNYPAKEGQFTEEFMKEDLKKSPKKLIESRGNSLNRDPSGARKYQRIASPKRAQIEPPIEESVNRSAVKPYTKSTNRQSRWVNTESENQEKFNNSSSVSRESPSKFSHFDQIKKNYQQRRQEDVTKQQLLDNQRDMEIRAVFSIITTEIIDKESSRLIRNTFQEELAREHEYKLIEERKAREQAEIEIARLKQENIQAKNKQIEIEKLAREEAEKEIQRLKKEKFERQQAELKRRQKMAEDRAERQKLQQMAEQMELEKKRLEKIAKENEVERLRIQQEAEQLKLQENNHNRSQSLMRMQMMEEEEIERQKLQKIARDKEERLKLQQKYQNQSQIMSDNHKRVIEIEKEKIKTKELEQEKIRLVNIRQAQQELEQLQQLRRQEEERLKKIKRDISLEEEYQRSYKASQSNGSGAIQRKIEKIAPDTQSKQSISYNNTKSIGGEIMIIDEISPEETPNTRQKKENLKSSVINKSKVNVYYEVRSSNDVPEDTNQNKSFDSPPEMKGMNRQTSKARNSSIPKVQDDKRSTGPPDYIRSSQKSQLSSPIKEETENYVQPQNDDQEKPPVEADLTEEDIEFYCDKFFGQEVPIKFKMRSGNKVEESISKLIKKLQIRIPIIHVRAGIYLIGASKVNLEQKFNHVMVRVGGGTERFDAYVPKNHRKFERLLIQYMSISQEDLQSVIDKIINGQKIRKPQAKKEDEGEKPKRNRSGNNVPVKRVQVKLHGDSSSRAGSIQSRRTMQIERDKESQHSGYATSQRSTSQGGGHFLNKSIVESINKQKIARGFSPVRFRADLKDSFGNNSNNAEAASTNTQINPYHKSGHGMAQGHQVNKFYKQSTPQVEDYDESTMADASKNTQFKATRFDIDSTPPFQHTKEKDLSPVQLQEPAKTTRYNFNRNSNHISKDNTPKNNNFQGSLRGHQFGQQNNQPEKSAALSPTYQKYQQMTGAPNPKPTVYQKMLDNKPQRPQHRAVLFPGNRVSGGQSSPGKLGTGMQTHIQKHNFRR